MLEFRIMVTSPGEGKGNRSGRDLEMLAMLYFFLFFFFNDFIYLFMRDTERSRYIGRGRSRLPVRSPMQDCKTWSRDSRITPWAVWCFCRIKFGIYVLVSDTFNYHFISFYRGRSWSTERQFPRVTQPLGGKTKFISWSSAKVRGLDPSPLHSLGKDIRINV